ncbi:hypothetical protein C8R46DRAFT_1076082 [Mycena filopes]|nr:hypothetical protein C8R46DRAFT_1076082 [Mycena filopes]
MDPSNIQRAFPLRYRLRAGRALTGSLTDLKELSSAIIYGQVSLTRDTLSLFLYQLRTPSNGAPRSLELVESVFRQLWDIFVAQGHPDPSITSPILDSWPDICSSLLELHHHTHPGDRNSVSFMGVPSLIILFLTAVMRWPYITSFPWSPRQLEDVMSILTDIWTSEAESKAINLDAPSAAALFALMRHRDSREMTTLFIAHFDTKYTLARLLLKRLCTSVRSHPSKWSHFELEATLIAHSSTVDEELEGYLIYLSSIRHYTTALIHLLSHPAAPDFATSIVLCLQYLAVTLNATKGVPWVAQALRAGILPALLQCAESYGERDDVNAQIVDLLGDTIPRYSVHKSILREISKSLAHILSAGLARSAYWSTAASIPKLWRDFVVLVTNDKKSKTSTTGRLNIPRAASPRLILPKKKCARDTIVNRNACSGCMCVRYCSTDCQRQHWNTHKSMCEQMRKTPGNEFVYHSGALEDRRFFNYILDHDLLRNQARIRDQRSDLLKKNPQLIASPFGVEVNYEFVPVRIIVLSLGSYEFKTESNPAFDVTALAVEKRGVETFVKLYIPSGRAHTMHALMSKILGDWDRVADE